MQIVIICFKQKEIKMTIKETLIDLFEGEEVKNSELKQKVLAVYDSLCNNSSIVCHLDDGIYRNRT